VAHSTYPLRGSGGIEGCCEFDFFFLFLFCYLLERLRDPWFRFGGCDLCLSPSFFDLALDFDHEPASVSLSPSHWQGRGSRM